MYKMTNKILQYPHQLTLISTCDVCNKNAKTKDIKILNTFLGWQVCDDIKCKYTIYLWRENVSIKKDELIEKYGKFVRIMRSSGQIENNWVIIDRAYKFYENDTWWIYVKNKDEHIKCISIKELRELNN